MTATIPRDPELIFVFDPDGAATPVDVSCYVVATDVQETASNISVATYCEPQAQELGPVTASITVAMRWSEDMYTALQPHIGEEFELQLKANKTDTKAVIARCRYAHLPWGRWEAGASIEADLVLAVLSGPDYNTPA